MPCIACHSQGMATIRTCIREHTHFIRCDGAILFHARFHVDPQTGDSLYDSLPLFRVQNGQIVRLTTG